ncbi:MAG: integration host factor subunit beta [Planctomycetaceae bacterium]|nr:integration host factor subunit beta [Planctomycetaceae bacterium]
MTKKEIVRDICQRANDEELIAKGNLTQLATKEIVQWTFEAIIATLVSEGRIELRNFGVFEVKQRKPRKARNPRTGARVDVEAKNVVTFQPGKTMEEKVRKFAKPIEPKKKTKKKGKAAEGKHLHDGKQPHDGKPVVEINDATLIAKSKPHVTPAPEAEPEPVGVGASTETAGAVS